MPISVPAMTVMRQMPRQGNGIGVSDGTVVKFAMIVGIMVVAYLIIKSGSNYSHSGRGN